MLIIVRSSLYINLISVYFLHVANLLQYEVLNLCYFTLILFTSLLFRFVLLQCALVSIILFCFRTVRFHFVCVAHQLEINGQITSAS